MDWQQILDILARLPPAQRQSWSLAAAGVLLLVGGLLWLESRYFRRDRRWGSWLTVRLVSALLAPLTLALTVLPARSVSGLEALAVFYGMLLFVAPPLWFGSHLLAGRWAKPPLSRGESLALALSGLLILSIPGSAVLVAQGPLNAAAREIAQQRTLPADNPPLPYTVQPVGRYDLPGVGPIYTQSLLAQPAVRLLAVELRQAGQWPGAGAVAHPVFCTAGNDVHLMWSAREVPPYLRLHWAKGAGDRQRAEFTPQLSVGPAPPVVEFSVGFRPDGLDPVAPIPRERAYLILEKPGAAPYTQLLGNPPEAGEQRATDCVMYGFRRWAADAAWSVRALGLVFYLPGGETRQALIESPGGR